MAQSLRALGQPLFLHRILGVRMNVSNLGDNLHRGVKIAVDSGEATSIAEAERLFAKYRLMIIVGPDVATSPTLQAALLTAVNTARRCCLGGVYVSGKLDADLLLPWKHCRTMGEAIIDLQGHIVNAPLPEVPAAGPEGRPRHPARRQP